MRSYDAHLFVVNLSPAGPLQIVSCDNQTACVCNGVSLSPNRMTESYFNNIMINMLYKRIKLATVNLFLTVFLIDSI